jgi:integrase
MTEPKKKRRRKGERPDGRIARTLTVGKKPDGTPIRKFFYGKTITEAERLRDEYKRLLKTGHEGVFEAHTVNDWIKEYLKTYGENPAYKPYFERLKKDFGSREISSIRHYQLQQSLNQFSGKSTSGAAKYRMIIKQVFYRAYRNKIILDDPSLDLQIPEGTVDGSHRALEPWEVKLISNNWNKHDNGIWFFFMLCTGVRRSEMAALTWENVNLDKRTVLIDASASFLYSNTPTIKERTKTAAGLRILPMPESLVNALIDKPLKTGMLFTTTGNPLSETIIKRNLKTFCKVMEQVHNGHPIDVKRQPKTEIKLISEINTEDKPFQSFSFRLHDLRHTYATALYDAGVDIKTAQYLLGHTDIKTTLKLYTHLSVQRKTEAFQDISNHLEATFGNLDSSSCSQNVVNTDLALVDYVDRAK